MSQHSCEVIMENKELKLKLLSDSMFCNIIAAAWIIMVLAIIFVPNDTLNLIPASYILVVVSMPILGLVYHSMNLNKDSDKGTFKQLIVNSKAFVGLVAWMIPVLMMDDNAYTLGGTIGFIVAYLILVQMCVTEIKDDRLKCDKSLSDAVTISVGQMLSGFIAIFTFYLVFKTTEKILKK